MLAGMLISRADTNKLQIPLAVTHRLEIHPTKSQAIKKYGNIQTSFNIYCHHICFLTNVSLTQKPI